jgi:hypothetical protein
MTINVLAKALVMDRTTSTVSQHLVDAIFRASVSNAADSHREDAI